MKFDKEMAWNLILIVSIILIVNGISDSGDPDKKTARVGQDQTIVGIAGIATFAGKKAVAPLLAGWPLVAAILGITFLAPNIFSNWVDTIRDLISPSSIAIPGWIWIAGFFVLALMILKKK